MSDRGEVVPPSGAPAEHRSRGPRAVRCAVITISDTRTEADDKSGQLIQERLRAAGHEIVLYRILKDEPDEIRRLVSDLADQGDVQAALLTGGTGLSSRDGTFEAVDSLLDKRLDGFGELFRMLSYEEIGAAAMLSRAVAGSRGRMAIFSMPGSSAAVRLAMEKLIVPELGHLVGQLEK